MERKKNWSYFHDEQKFLLDLFIIANSMQSFILFELLAPTAAFLQLFLDSGVFFFENFVAIFEWRFLLVCKIVIQSAGFVPSHSCLFGECFFVYLFRPEPRVNTRTRAFTFLSLTNSLSRESFCTFIVFFCCSISFVIARKIDNRISKEYFFEGAERE